MTNEKTPLPEFERPPVVEVALAAQFDPLEMGPSQLVDLALQMRALGYQKLEQHPPLQKVIESFGSAPLRGRIAFEFGFPSPRYWFISTDNEKLIQIQSDRFICNWRATDADHHYPRYPSIRDFFKVRLSEFVAFATEQKMGSVSFNQVEVTYVNRVRSEQVIPPLVHLANVLGSADITYTDKFLPAAEDAFSLIRYQIDEGNRPLGRLHVSAQCTHEQQQDNPAVMLSLTARGIPLSSDIAGVLGFMDIGHEWVVRGFADSTRAEMHAEWGRTS